MVSQKGSPTLQVTPYSSIDKTIHGDPSGKGEKTFRSWFLIRYPDVLKDKNKNRNIVFLCIKFRSPERASYDNNYGGTLWGERVFPQKDLLERNGWL